MMLSAEQWRLDKLLGVWEVLNEVVVSRGQIVRPVNLITQVDGRFLTTYVADGLIASTPTGSTAYALAAGGPILPPELRNILLVPLAPHLSLDRAIVLAEGSSVSISIETDHQAVLSVDGQVPIEFVNGDRVDVRASDHTVKFVRIQDPGYFYRNLTPHMYQNPSIDNQK
jgi:NAD+ kinase